MVPDSNPFVRGYQNLSVRRLLAITYADECPSAYLPLHSSQAHMRDDQVRLYPCIFCDDFALITEVLPGAEDRAKDLGVINVANALPQVFAPVLAGVLLAVVEATGGAVDTDGDGFSTGYLVVYAVAFLASVLGSVFVTRIKGVR